jgi:hypothetical protein
MASNAVDKMRDLNTSEIVNQLADDGNSTIDIRKLIQQRTLKARQHARQNNPSITTSLNFNEMNTSPPKHLLQAPDSDEEEDDEDESIVVNTGKRGGGGNGGRKAPGPTVVQHEDDDDEEESLFQPQRAKNVKIPANIDFGLDMIANKQVLDVLSDDEEDIDDNRAKNLFQGDGPRNKPKRRSYAESEEDEGVYEDDEDGAYDDEEEYDDEEDGAYDVDDGDIEDVDDSQINDSGSGGHIFGLNSANANVSIGLEEEDDDGAYGSDQSSMALNLGGMSDDEGDSGRRPRPKKERRMTRHELNVAKRKELTKIERLEKKGYKACKKFTMADKYDDMVAERERLDDERGLDESIKWQRKILMGVCTGGEYLNKMYDPFDLKLDGWSESMYENITDYDEVFEELYHKYKNKVKVAPEIKLLGMVAGSALMFHFSKTLFTKAEDQVPGFEDVMRDNPELRTAYEQAAMRKMNMNNDAPNNAMSSMFGNFLGNPMLGNMLGGLFGSGGGPGGPGGPRQAPPQGPPRGVPRAQPQQSAPMSYPQQRPHPQQNQGPQVIRRQPRQPQPQSQPQQPQMTQQHMDNASQIEMDGPTGVDDLLASLTRGTNQDLTELQLSDAGDTGSLSELGSNIKSVTFPTKRTTRNNNRRRRLNLNR